MKTEKEIREAIEACYEVASFGVSNGPCPFDEGGAEGCCAECSTISSLQWVLNDSARPNKNGQDLMFEALREFRYYEYEKDNEIPCGNTDCPYHNERAEQNCGGSLENDEPAVVDCTIYYPVEDFKGVLDE